jgi:hypothetical protein
MIEAGAGKYIAISGLNQCGASSRRLAVKKDTFAGIISR